MWAGEIRGFYPGNIRQLTAIPHCAVHFHFTAPTFTCNENTGFGQQWAFRFEPIGNKKLKLLQFERTC
jgi:hypothetical protein